MRIYIIRHGDPDYELDSLTPRGELEAVALAEYLSTMKVDYLFSSPLGRAIKTASFSESLLQLPVEILPWAAELSLKASDGSGWPAFDENPQSLRSDPETGADSSWLDALCEVRFNSDKLFERFGWFRDGYVYSFNGQSNNEKHAQIAVFCHGGFGLTWLAHLLGLSVRAVWSSFFLHPSSVTTVLMDERVDATATPRVIALSDTAHLYKAGLEPSRMGIKANYY
ncbi:MAG TPA: histidine phosphatase family protein [Spirochaetota bacterium]|nr:histidine phosphatase family protein [Spirochaetota bacterium]